MSDQFLHVPLAEITASLTNPRTTSGLDQASLAELAEDIKRRGVDTPILLRPLPGERAPDSDRDVCYEIVAGERRLRASLLAGMATIPARIRTLNDVQALEVQLGENMHRQDLSPLEEAQGIHNLMEKAGIDADQVAKNIEKSRTYVYNRLKLLDLCQEAKAALREGQLDASRAELVARIPDQKLQLKALKELTARLPGTDEYRMSYRQAKIWLAQNVMLRLEHAVFDIKAASLCEAAGSCTDCPKRTGANPDLFADVDSPDVCTDPPCFHAKEQAHHDQVVAKARQSGIEVIEGEEADRIVRHHYIDGYERTESRIQDPRTGAQTPRHMLLAEFFDKAKVKAATRIIIDPNTYEPIKVVTEELAQELDELLDKATAKSKTVSKEDKARAQERVKEDETRKQHQLAKKYEGEWRTRVLAALQPQLLAGVVNTFQPDVLRALLVYLVSADLYEGDEAIQVALGLAEDDEALGDLDALVRRIQTLDDLELGNRICLYIAVKQATELEQWAGNLRTIAPAPALLSLANSAGVDAAAIQAEVQDEMREEMGVQPKSEPKAKGKKATPPNDPAAQPTPVPPAAATTPAKGKKKGAKISAEQAQLGIAAAMQGQESAAAAAEGGTVAMPGDSEPWPFPGADRTVEGGALA